MKAAPHPRQDERLSALRGYNILDTQREPDFDDVVELASRICGTPISVVNLIDVDRQWFKAEVGLGVRETPLSTSLCAHAILEDEFVEIPDTLVDRRMADNPLVTGDKGLRFYAGALLKTADGLPLGTLCVLDYEPRVLTPLQRDTLRVLARQVMGQLDLRRALRQADVLRQEVDHRVKNSLQSLASIAGIQARAAGGEAAEALRTMRGRIQSIAMLHELLYRTDAGGAINMANYLGLLAGHLQSIAQAGVTVSAVADPVALTSKEATLIGTIINEFFANSFKHAFPEARPGRVTAALESDSSGLTLDLSDDGVGMADVQASSGLGMMILKSAIQQLSGTVTLSSDPGGTRLLARFPATT